MTSTPRKVTAVPGPLPCPVLVYTVSFGTAFTEWYLSTRPPPAAHYASPGCTCGWIAR